MDFSEEVKTALWDLIDEMSQNKFNYVVHPSKDFSRKKKWDFPTLMKFIISMESQSLKNELHILHILEKYKMHVPHHDMRIFWEVR